MKKFLLFLTVLLISAAFYGAGAASHLDIAINIAETKEYSFFELDKVISLNPDIAQVKKLSDRAYSVTGVSRGSTFLIFWNYSGEKAAIKVNVSYPAPAVQDEGSLSKTDEESLKFGYNFFTYNGSSVSQYDFNRWSYSGLFHQLNASGQTPLGMTNSYIQYEGYNGRYGITKMALGFKTEKYYFNLGDSFADLSELTLPFLNYQGLYYNLTPNEYFEMTAATGASANGLWGKSVWNDSRPKQTFGAVKLLVRPRRNLNFSLSAVTSSQEVTGQGSNILALGAMYRPFDRLTLQGEAANAASGGGAYKAEAAYTGDNLYLKGTYRSIGADYITPSDSVNWRGTDGFYLSGSYRPLSNVDIGFSSDRYINTYLQGPSSTFYNSDVKGSLRVRAGSGTVFTYSPWKEDRRGFASGGIGEGSITQLSHDFNFIVPNTIYARYEPTKFTQSNTVESDYVNDRMLMGLRLGVSQALSLNIERGWETRTLLYNLSQENTNFIRMLLNYNSKLGRTPLYTSVNSQYYNSTSASGTGLTEMWADAELGYELDQRAKAYVRGKVANYIGTGGSTADRCENHVSFGLKVLFDTGSKWKGLSYVSGHVFVDQNGDGIFSEGEKGIPGARILVGSRTVVTDRSGRYFVGAVTAGATKVKLDLSSIGSGYILTAANPREIDTKTTQTADFGVVGQPSVRGSVYFDSNSNNVFDSMDKPMQGVKILYEGGSVITDANGNYEIFDLIQGEQTISMDIDTAPAEYNAAGSSVKVIVRKGSVAYADFKLGLPKAIYGYVYIDGNRNGRKDSKETGVAGIEMQLDGRTAVTGSDGMYVFKNVNYGVNKIIAVRSTIPASYFMPDTTLAKFVNVKRGGKAAYEVNFRLKKK